MTTKSIKIIGTGRALPAKRLSNEELAGFLDTSDEWITSKTGIKTRSICTMENLTDLAAAAALKALKTSGLPLSAVDMLICPTVSGDYQMPSLACCVAERIGLNCPAFDISAACTGFIYALDTAEAFISSGKAKNILIVAAEMMSRVLDWNDRSSCILFGDGAAGCVVTAGDSLKYIRTASEPGISPLFIKAASGSPFSAEEADHSPTPFPPFLQMQGQQVYKFAVKTIESEIHHALTALNLTPQDVDYFILHQANTRIIDGARSRLKLPPEKFPTNIHEYGNMSAASIPVLLDEMVEDGRVQKGSLLMLVGFGAGMTSGCVVLEWSV